MMAFFDADHPFYDPIWRRVAVVGVCVGWGVFEFATNAPIWGLLFVGGGAIAFYQLFIARGAGEEGSGDC